jgi:tellurite resistance protein
MFKRLVDLARTAIGVDPEAGPVESFRSMLVEILKSPPAGGIDLGDLRARAGVSDDGASRVVAELYLRFARKVAADGVITAAERAKLDGLAATLGLSEPKAGSIEQIAGSEVYEDAARRAMADGVVTLEEAAHLADLRRNLLPEPDDDETTSGVEAGLVALFDRAAFREALVRDFKRLDPRTFRLASYAADAGVPPAVAAEVAEELYARFADKVLADGFVTPGERAHLDLLAAAFQVAPAWAAGVEARAGREVYRKAVLEALADGTVSPAEAARLDALRTSLGIEAGQAVQAAGGLAAEAYEALIRRIAGSGVVDERSIAEIDRFKRGLGLSDADTTRMIRARALDLYRETFAEILQDGKVTRPQEELLGWLQAETGLGAAEIAPFADRLAEAKRLAEYRSGRLPLVETRKLLEGGENCHWDSPCRHTYQAARGPVHVEGELVATGKRVIFVSPTRNFSFAPWKIVDIEGRGHRVTLKVEIRQGSGDYQVDRPRELEAILVGLARKGKYTAAGGTGSELTRHIPGEVKRAVWARDGGRCVECRDDRYLEFDHIIPHSQGGANTFGNVQLLCRKCNNEKSDRI